LGVPVHIIPSPLSKEEKKRGGSSMRIFPVGKKISFFLFLSGIQ